MSGTTTGLSVNVLCDQRKKQMIFNAPQARYTPINPYNGVFTKEQLDMRRKAEILKFNNTSSTSKTNNLTKAQKFAQIVSGKAQKQNYQDRTITTIDQNGIYNTVNVKYPNKLIINKALQSDIGAVEILGNTGYFTYSILPNGFLVNCQQDNLIPTPTYASGIPGPITTLIDDESVPLYNYTNTTINNAAYSQSQIADNATMWKVNSLKNIKLLTNNSVNVGSVLIKPNVEENSYVFTLEIPIGVYDIGNPGVNGGSARITITDIALVVKYSGSTVQQSNINISLTKNSFNSKISVNYTELSNPINGYNYFADLDIINISGILLNTTPGYIYDFYLTLNINSVNSNSTFNNYSIVSNYSNDNTVSKMYLLTSKLLPPTNLLFSSSTNDKIDIIFTPPETTTNPIISYTANAYTALGIHQGNQGLASSIETNIIIPGLSPNNTYYINVTANYNNGSSTSLERIRGATLYTDATNYVLLSSSATSFTLNFLIGADVTIDKYFIRANPDNNSNNGQLTVDSSQFSLGPITINNLRSGTKYDLQLCQTYKNSNDIKVAQDISGTTLSPPPTILSISDISYTRVKLNYNVPSGTSPIGYIITSTPSDLTGRPVITDLSNTAVPSSPITITDLSSGVNYSIIMNAVYNKYINDPILSLFNSTSNSLSYTTTYTAATILSAIDITTTTLNLVYRPAPGTFPLSYTVNISPSSTDTFIDISPNINPIHITGLSPETTYSITITSKYIVGYITSIPFNVTTKGTAATSLVIKNQTATSVDVSFNVPDSAIPDGYFATAVPIPNSPITDTYETVIYPVPPNYIPNTFTLSGLITIPDLNSGCNYTVTVTSVYPVTGNIVSTGVRATTLYNPVTNITSVPDTNSITISYDPPIGTIPFSYYAIATPFIGQSISTINTRTTNGSLTIPGLISGTTYNIIVYSKYSVATAASTSITVTSASNPPTNLQFVTSDTNTITISFTPPQIGTAPIRFEATTASEGFGTASALSTQIVIYGLHPNTSYSGIKVSAIYTNTTSSTTMSVAHVTTGIPPSNIRVNAAAGNVGTNFIIVSFDKPDGEPPIGYTVSANNGGTGTGSATVTSITMTGLQPNTLYNNIVVYASYSLGSYASIGIDYYTIGYAATNLITTSYANAIKVDFTAPSQTNPPLGYIITAVPDPITSNNGQLTIIYPENNSNTIIENTVPLTYIPTYINSNPITVPDLVTGTIYTITVISVYYSGTVASNTVTASTLSPPPTITSISSDYNSLTVAFFPPSGTITIPKNYTATAIPDTIYSGNGQLTKSTTATQASTSTNYITITDLIAGSKYDVTVTANYTSTTNSLLNAISNDISGTTLSTFPTITGINKTLSDISTNAITVYFDEPVGGKPIKYLALAKPEQTDNEQSDIYYDNLTRGATSYEFKGLVPGTTYDISLSAVYDVVTNSVPTFVIGNTITNPPTITGINSGILDASTNAITVYFNEPVGGKPLRYVASAKPEQRDNEQRDVYNYNLTRGATSYEFTGLVPGTTYDISLSAVYDIFTNSTQSFVIGNTITKPPTITGINKGLTDASVNAITVYFNEPVGGKPLRYVASAIPEQRDNEQQDSSYNYVSRGATSYEFTGLIPGTNYDISLSAVYDISINSVTNFVIGNTITKPPTITGINSGPYDASVNAITVYFNEPVGGKPLRYVVSAKPEQKDNEQIDVSNNFLTRDATSYEFKGLISGTTYDISLSAVYDISINSTPSFAIGNTLSNSPTDLILSNITSTSIQVDFTRPFGSLPKSYSISAYPNENNNSQEPRYFGLVKGLTTYTFNNLVPGTNYDISLSAIYSINTTTSDYVTGKTLMYPPTITRVNKNVGDASTNSITIYFDPPIGGGLPINYTANVVPTTFYNGQQSKNYPEISNGATSYELKELISGTTYNIILNAVYDTEIVPSNQIAGTTISNAPTITTTSSDEYNITVKFVPPIGSLPIRYRAIANPKTNDNEQEQKYVDVDNADIQNTYINAIIDSSFIIIDSLISGTVYDISLVSIYDNNVALIYNEITNITSNRVSVNTTAHSPTIYDITENGATTLTINFDAPYPGSLPLKYIATAMPRTNNNEQNSSPQPYQISRDATTYQITGLVSGTIYDVSMAAVYNTGNFISNVSSASTTIIAPTLTSITNSSATAMTINFTLPSDYSKPLSYNATAIPNSTDNGQSTILYTGISRGSTSYALTGLISGTTYDISMATVYNICNANSGIISGSTTTIAPILNSITNQTATGMTINFTLPIGYSKPLKYFALAIPRSTDNEQDTNPDPYEISRDATSYQLTGLISGTVYDVSMAAVYNTGNVTSNKLS